MSQEHQYPDFPVTVTIQPRTKHLCGDCLWQSRPVAYGDEHYCELVYRLNIKSAVFGYNVTAKLVPDRNGRLKRCLVCRKMSPWKSCVKPPTSTIP